MTDVSEPIIMRALPAELDWDTSGHRARVTHVWCAGCGDNFLSEQFGAHWDAQHPEGPDHTVKIVNPSSKRVFWAEGQG